MGYILAIVILVGTCCAFAVSSPKEMEIRRPNTITSFACSEKYLAIFYTKQYKLRNSDSLAISSQEVGSHDFPRELRDGMTNPFEISNLHRNLIGEGSHRRLLTSLRIKINSAVVSQLDDHLCEAVLVERLPTGVFADPFELQQLVNRQVFLDAAVLGDTNLELPSALSNQSTVEIHIDLMRFISSDYHVITIELPLHARYPPLGDNTHFRVEFGMPAAFVRCRPRSTRFTPSSCILTNFSDISVSSIVWLVPCGNKEHTAIVSSITFASALFSAFLIVLSAVCCSMNEDFKGPSTF